jgi:quercetin dioxygenase-like cupin family protein
MPADIAVGDDIEDMGLRTLGRMPPPGGTRFAIIDLPPQCRGQTHRTDSIDYVIIMSGEIDMVSDTSTVHLKAGDVVVQRGANHAWINSTDDWVRLSLIKIDAKPLDIGHE